MANKSTQVAVNYGNYRRFGHGLGTRFYERKSEKDYRYSRVSIRSQAGYFTMQYRWYV